MRILRTLWLACALALCALPAHADPVNVNQADADTLAAALDGIGPVKAQAIVAYRDEHGSFTSASDLTRVKGIGSRIVEMNRDSIRLGSAAGAR